MLVCVVSIAGLWIYSNYAPFQLKASLLNVVIEPLRGMLPDDGVIVPDVVVVVLFAEQQFVTIVLLSMRWHQRKPSLHGSPALQVCKIGKHLDIWSVFAPNAHGLFLT